MDKTLRNRFAAAALAVPIIAASAPALADSDVTMRSVGGDDIAMVAGQSPKRVGDTEASFQVDLTKYGLWELKKLGDKPYTAVVFDGNTQDTGRQCPLIDTSTRLKEIKQVGRDLVFETRTTASDAEYAAVEKAGCLIAPTAKLSEIKFN